MTQHTLPALIAVSCAASHSFVHDNIPHKGSFPLHVQIRADDGQQVTQHVLPALMAVRGPAFADDVLVLNFGLHFGGHKDQAQYKAHIGLVSAFHAQHKVGAGLLDFELAATPVTHGSPAKSPSTRRASAWSLPSTRNPRWGRRSLGLMLLAPLLLHRPRGSWQPPGAGRSEGLLCARV